MPNQSINLAVNENFNGEEVISHLIETARTLKEADQGESLEFFEKALHLSRNAGFSSGSAECLLELGRIQFSRDNIRQSLSYLQEAVLLFEKANDLLRACESSRVISDICFAIGNYEQSLESQLKSLQFIKKIDDKVLQGSIHNKLGDIYKVLGDYKKAIGNHELSLAIFESLDDKPTISATCYYIGNCYNWADDIDQAFALLDRSLVIADEINDPELKVKPTGSLAILFTKMKEYDKAMEYFFQAIDYVNITGNLLLKADLMKSFGNLYIETGNYDKAIAILNESLSIAESLKIKYPKSHIHRFLADAHERAGDFENALVHHKQYTKLSGELMNEEIALKTKGLQLRYDYEETRKEKEQAQQTVLLKDQFIANISHEIRTPLNGVLGMANLLADTKPTPEQLEYINTIKLSANNLIVTINDILDFSKIHSGEIRFDSHEFQIRDLLKGIAQVLKVKSDEKQIRLNLTYDENIPEILIGDAARLNQILLNLIANAIKFTDKGSVNVEMQLVESHGFAIKILFAITDTGIGIPAEKINHIFESFTQVNNDISKVSGGTGLGLAIVKHLVELQGGTVAVNSKIDSGSVFKVELPFRVLTKLEKQTTSGNNIKTEVPLKDLSTVDILLVEDNKVNQFLAQKLLNKMGFHVSIANDGNEAIRFLKKIKFDLILMDVQMPVMNGYELTQLIRTTLPSPLNKIPIIALTAYASTVEKEKALGLGMSDYVTKPYSPQELLSAILRQVSKLKQPEIQQTESELTDINAADIKFSSEKLIQLFSGNIEDVLSLFHMLTGQIPLLIKESGIHIAEQNWPATFQSVHKLKSSVNLLKISRLKNLVNELEEFSRDQTSTDRIPPIFEEFKIACEQTVCLLKEEIIRLKKL